MPSAREIAEQTVGVCRLAAEELAGWQNPAAAGYAQRLMKVAAGLESVLNRAFLKTRASLAFAGPLLDIAQRVAEDIQSLLAGGAGAAADLQADLASLENEAGILIDKSTPGDTVIT